ncbi:hypothetical protein NL108_006746 [Boleophthalmus pectinirostris]|uniref:zona pellucida-like domain-containing protein 1 n=1 Tax=Boleophthalmus pectinirostris TaxID=150288 RepID=UPI00242CE5C4|nr:zona pellucida-like domain-containing protein 1 [Boleophthalmus pectinirostris]KAJ0063789.1 hypothetical protein NL108_006746 [Boleophthalmus pectinirostris]
MKVIIFTCLLFLIIKTDAQTIPASCSTSDTNRSPENSDIKVVCGTESMDLRILLCPIYNANYNETLMILNGQTNTECKGTPDFTTTPPVLKFKFSINQQSLSSCNNVFRIFDVVGSGDFSQFSSIQHVNISGRVESFDPTPGMITYRSQLTYMYSCQYPLQYVLNNTEMAVAGVSLAITDNNGSFISTLTMGLFNGPDFLKPLIIPTTGLGLKEQIYVQVSASNLSDRFNVLLDRCFATVGLYPDSTPGYDLFIGCNQDPQTKVLENGISQKASFVFEAFRFVQHKNMTVSRFYLHCIARLCNVSMCASMLPTCPGNRRRRATEGEDSATITSSEILVGKLPTPALVNGQGNKAGVVEKLEYSSPVVAVIVCVALLSVLLVMMGAYFTWTLRHKLRH